MEIKDIFSERLKELMEAGGETVEQLSHAIGEKTGINVSVGSLSDYRKGRARANIEALYGIALHYGVTTDWLLGLSNVKEASAELTQVCNYTGLSQNSVQQLHYSETNGRYKLPIKLIDEIMRNAVRYFEHDAKRAALARIQSDQITGYARKDSLKRSSDLLKQFLADGSRDSEQNFYDELRKVSSEPVRKMVDVPVREASLLYRDRAVRSIEHAAEQTMKVYIDSMRQLVAENQQEGN